MRSSTVQELKQELSTMKGPELVQLSLRLARFKKENKELLTYLLFEAHDEEGFVRNVKTEIEELFTTVNQTQLYLAKKTLRKMVRLINKYSRYSGNKASEIEMRIFFCLQLKSSAIPYRQSTATNNIFEGQVKKIKTLLGTLHEDLQHDYKKDIITLEEDEGGFIKWIFPKKKK